MLEFLLSSGHLLLSMSQMSIACLSRCLASLVKVKRLLCSTQAHTIIDILATHRGYRMRFQYLDKLSPLFFLRLLKIMREKPHLEELLLFSLAFILIIVCTIVPSYAANSNPTSRLARSDSGVPGTGDAHPGRHAFLYGSLQT